MKFGEDLFEIFELWNTDFVPKFFYRTKWQRYAPDVTYSNPALWISSFDS